MYNGVANDYNCSVNIDNIVVNHCIGIVRIYIGESIIFNEIIYRSWYSFTLIIIIKLYHGLRIFESCMQLNK